MAALQKIDDAPRQTAVLKGLTAAFKGQRSVAEPAGWETAEMKLDQSPDASTRALTQALALTFGSKHSLETTRRTLANTSASLDDRKRALEALLNVKDAQLPPVLLDLLGDTRLRDAALRGLAVYADPKTPGAILAIYPSLPAPEKRDALGTLASRAAFARPLLAAMADGRVPAKDVSADIGRQIRQLNEPDINRQLEKVWGSARESSADKIRGDGEVQETHPREKSAGGRLARTGGLSQGRAANATRSLTPAARSAPS